MSSVWASQSKLKARASLLLQTAACCKTADSFLNYLSSAVWIMYRSCLLWLVDSVFSGLCQRNWTLFCATGLHYTRYTNNLFRPFIYLQALPAHSEIIVALSAHNLTRQNLFMFDNGSRKGYYFIHQPTYVTLNSILSRYRTKYTDNFFFK